jgi:hypothetical protein
LLVFGTIGDGTVDRVRFKPELTTIAQARVESLALQNLDLTGAGSSARTDSIE